MGRHWVGMELRATEASSSSWHLPCMLVSQTSLELNVRVRNIVIIVSTTNIQGLELLLSTRLVLVVGGPLLLFLNLLL